jgi:hypothetical protein
MERKIILLYICYMYIYINAWKIVKIIIIDNMKL